MNNSSGSYSYIVECEAYANGTTGFNDAGYCIYDRCISHDNLGASGHGFAGGAGVTWLNCVADSNAANGFHTINGSGQSLLSCDAYGNAGSGVNFGAVTATTLLLVENCNFIGNTLYGINASGTGPRRGLIRNCGFGSGTQTNSSGSIADSILTSAISTIIVSNTVTYAADVTPWTAPATGNFSISLTAAKSMGRGTFTETAAGYSGTAAYPDIGAAQSASTNAAGGEHSHVFAQ